MEDKFEEVLKALNTTERELDEALKEALLTGKYEDCLSLPELERLPLVAQERASHVLSCEHCKMLFNLIVRSNEETL